MSHHIYNCYLAVIKILNEIKLPLHNIFLKKFKLFRFKQDTFWCSRNIQALSPDMGAEPQYRYNLIDYKYLFIYLNGQCPVKNIISAIAW